MAGGVRETLRHGQAPGQAHGPKGDRRDRETIGQALDVICLGRSSVDLTGGPVGGRHGADVLARPTGGKWWPARPVALPGARRSRTGRTPALRTGPSLYFREWGRHFTLYIK